MYVNIDGANRIVQTAEWIYPDVAELPSWAKVSNAPASVYEEHGIPRYKLVDGAAVERTQAEIDADIAAIPAPEPTPQDDTDALLADHEERLIYMELGV